MRAIAVDDEPLALQLVEGYIRRTPFLEFAGVFDSPLNALEFIDEEPVDLIFLDIQMPDLSGTEFARILKSGPKIIFTTAYEKYALEGFRLDAVDYLLKPFGYEEFLKAAQKAFKLFELERKENAGQIEANNEYLFLKSEYKLRRINFDEILYIEGLKDYVKVYLVNEHKPVLSINTLKALESKLPFNKFMRVHKSYIVNLEKIRIVERMRIIFNDKYIPIGEQFKDKFQEFIDKNFI